LEAQEVRELTERHRVAPATSKTIVKLPRLMQELATTRRRGYAIDDEEHAVGVRCVAAPIFSASGDVVASIGVSATASQLNDDYLPVVGNILKSVALKLSAQLGSRSKR
jgi:IclR family acetate operon transcriptional repressor